MSESKSLTVQEVDKLLDNSIWQNSEYKFQFINNNLKINDKTNYNDYSVHNNAKDGEFYIKTQYDNYKINIKNIDEYSMEINYPLQDGESIKLFKLL